MRRSANHQCAGVGPDPATIAPTVRQAISGINRTPRSSNTPPPARPPCHRKHTCVWHDDAPTAPPPPSAHGWGSSPAAPRPPRTPRRYHPDRAPLAQARTAVAQDALRPQRPQRRNTHCGRTRAITRAPSPSSSSNSMSFQSRCACRHPAAHEIVFSIAHVVTVPLCFLILTSQKPKPQRRAPTQDTNSPTEVLRRAQKPWGIGGFQRLRPHAEGAASSPSHHHRAAAARHRWDWLPATDEQQTDSRFRYFAGSTLTPSG